MSTHLYGCDAAAGVNRIGRSRHGVGARHPLLRDRDLAVGDRDGRLSTDGIGILADAV